MTLERTPFPGSEATAVEIFRLAEEYRIAANALSALGRSGDHLSRAPFRLTATHAVELYLNAWMLLDGVSPAAIRALHHDLGKRADHALASGLGLRGRTAAHLVAMSDRREYLVSRYAPRQFGTLSQINRLTATMDEIAAKVKQRIDRQAATGAPDVCGRDNMCRSQKVAESAPRPR
ncbi:hypothetical protein U0C82_04520 [Fulvimarina sp. 2208YS6-2-32]|uniref:HEPN domain-containing protein n=1 Tax=Fulvimarina uroteuthidis TaxID=3098149 RepID=A0ABU5HZX0_9HYPH|nr:hypothetical protein [Fulvimarina sp. 2208YS6-2-32]MDY8108417.1 hypothetical protein [Fulvimarina sp. 2208YS6-2-32]